MTADGENGNGKHRRREQNELGYAHSEQHKHTDSIDHRKAPPARKTAVGFRDALTRLLEFRPGARAEPHISACDSTDDKPDEPGPCRRDAQIIVNGYRDQR